MDHMEEYADESGYSSPEDGVFANEVREALTAVIRTLNEDTRETFCLYYMDGLKVDQIAAYQGIKAGTVKSRLHTARGKLREELAMYKDMV